MTLRVGVILLVALSACKTVVTTTTEVRPNRYAILEFTRAVSHDSIMAYAERAVIAEKLAIQSIDEDGGILTAGPVKFVPSNGEPELEATVTISAQTSGAETRVRLFATSPLLQNQMGGRDARLMSLIQRLNDRLDKMIGH